MWLYVLQHILTSYMFDCLRLYKRLIFEYMINSQTVVQLFFELNILVFLLRMSSPIFINLIKDFSSDVHIVFETFSMLHYNRPNYCNYLDGIIWF